MRRSVILLALLGVLSPSVRAESPAIVPRRVPDLPKDAPPVAFTLRDAMARALEGLSLPDSPAPYRVEYAWSEGQNAVVLARNGALVETDASPVAQLRTEVRVGDALLDSSNYDDFGTTGVRVATAASNDPQALAWIAWRDTDAAWKGATEALARKIASRRGKPPQTVPDWSAAPSRALAAVPAATTGAGTAPCPDLPRLEDLARKVSAAALVDPAVELADIDARESTGRRLVLSSEGLVQVNDSRTAVVRLTALARMPDGSLVGDERSWIGRGLGDLPSVEAMEAEAREMGAWMAGLARAPVQESWLGPVIFEEGASVEFFSQLLQPEVSGTPAAETDAPVPPEPPHARLGRRLLPEGWSVVDDAPGHPMRFGSYRADHEGTPPQRVELIVDGVLRDVLLTRVPRGDRAASTGHARALGADRRVAVPAVVEVTPPALLRRKALEKRAFKLAAEAGLDHVLVIRRLSPAALEGVGLRLSSDEAPPGLTTPSEAYRLYRDGRRVPVRGLRFSGVDRRSLRDIAAASKGPGWTALLDGPPGPGRYSLGPVSGLGVSWDVPDVLVSEMELVGAGGGEPRVIPLRDPASTAVAPTSSGLRAAGGAPDTLPRHPRAAE